MHYTKGTKRTIPSSTSRTVRLKSLTRLIRQACCVSAGMLFGQQAFAGPEGGQIVGGEGSISQGGATTTVQQSSQNLAIEWQQFNVAAEETVRFVQPSADAAVLNRILDQNPSQIYGSIEANGRVFLINPNGLIFGQTANVNVGSLVASTLDISTADFMAGNYTFKAPEGGEGGMVVNRGIMKAATGGSINLIGGTVANEGLILADYGQVNLGAGRQVTLDFDGDGLIRFQVDEEVLTNAAGIDSAVSNSGQISAEGGSVLLTAQAARDVFSSVVNNEGVIRAGRIENQGGVVRLVGSGGLTTNAGTIDAGGRTAADSGGTVEVLGDKVGLMAGSGIDASGPAGGGTVLVGGDYQGSGETQTAQRTYVDAGASITADATEAGDGGKVIVWADEATGYYGSISAKGGAESGDGGFVEVSGKQALQFDGLVDTSAVDGAYGMLLLDPTNIYVVAAGAYPDEPLITLSGSNKTINWNDNPGSDSYIDAASLNVNANVTLQATQDVYFETSVSNANTGKTLTVQAGDDIYVGYIHTTDGSAPIATGASITTTGGAVTLAANYDVDGGGGAAPSGTGKVYLGGAINSQGGAVSLSGTVVVVDGAQTIATSVPNNSSGSVGISAPLSGAASGASLSIDTGAGLNDSGGDVSVAGIGDTTGSYLQELNVNVTGKTPGTVTFNGNATVSGTLTVNGKAAMGADISLTASEIDFNGGAGSVSGSGNLSLQSFGAATPIALGGVGGTDVSGQLDLTATDLAALADGFNGITISSGGEIATAGSVLLKDDATLSAGTDIKIGHGITNTGSLTFNGPVVVTGSQSVSSSGGSLLFQGAVSKDAGVGGALIVDAADSSGTVTFTGDVTLDGLTANAGSYELSLNGGTTITAAANFANSGRVTLANGGSFGSLTHTAGETAASGTVSTTTGAVNLGTQTLVLNGDTTVNTSGYGLSFGAVTGNNHALTLNTGTMALSLPTLSNLSALSVTGGTLTLTGDISAGSGGVDLSKAAAIALNDSGGTLAITTTGGAVNLNSTGGLNTSSPTAVQNLSIDAGNGAVDLGDVGQRPPEPTFGDYYEPAKVTVTSTGATTLHGDIRTGSGGLDLSGASSVVLADADRTVAITAPGAVLLNGGSVSGTANANGLRIAGGGALTLAGNISTSGGMDLGTGTAATLSGNTTLTESGSGTVDLSRGINGGTHSFVANGGTINLSGPVSADGGVSFGGGANVVLLNDVTVTGANVSFQSANINGSGWTLTLNTGGNVALDNVGGAGTPVNLVFSSGIASLSLYGDLYLMGGFAPNVSGVVTVGDSALVDTTSASGTVALNGSALKGPGGLTVNSGAGDVTLADVDASAPLAYLVINSAGVTRLGDVTASGAAGINLSGAANVDLRKDTTFHATGGGVDLTGGAVDGPHALNVVAAGAAVLGHIGQNQSPTAIHVSAGYIHQSGSIRSSGGVDFSARSGITMGAGSGSGVVTEAGGTIAGTDGVAIRYLTDSGDIELGLLKATGTGDVLVDAYNARDSSILSQVAGTGVRNVETNGGNVKLHALGRIGAHGAPIGLYVPAPGAITLKNGNEAIIENILGAPVSNLGGGVISDSGGKGLSSASKETSASATKPGYVDWSVYSAEVSLFGVIEPGLRLPDDQLEEVALSQDTLPEIPILSRTGEGWRLWWDFDHSPSGASGLWQSAKVF